jgi:hypothetical protein
MRHQRRWLVAGLLVVIVIAATAVGEFVCLKNRRYPFFVAEHLMTEKQLRITYSPPDEEVVTTPDMIEKTQSATSYDYSIVRARAHGRRVRVLVWRHRCLCRKDSVTAFVDPANGRVLYITAAYPL